MPKRCALGCPPSGVSTHMFPNPSKHPDTFKAWVDLIGGTLNTALDYEFYRKKVICDIHFTAADRNRNHRLNCLAVPSLFLTNDPLFEHNYFKKGEPKDAQKTTNNFSRKKVPVMVLGKYKQYKKQIKNLKTQLRRTRQRTQNFKARLANTTINIIIYSWCRSINRILTGKIKYEGDDETKMFAQNYYFRHSNYKNKK
ncbi:hypothetical protein ABMA28_016746 [Loxostege sticticalis]|uniref:THAP-type domain-containing protein n=1 Tax=Loxostege sticticalis TaxID=481309 RepID=A0ABD0T5T7_LOXSC